MLLIEDTEIKMWESIVNTSAKCTIKNNVFSCLRSEETLFNSDIYKYDDVCVVACREPRFGENYLNIAVYDDSYERAWPLVTVPYKLDTAIMRLGRENFLVWTNSNLPENSMDMKQCSFCYLNENEKVDNITVDYHTLRNMQLLNGNRILIEYSQNLGGVGGVERKTVTTLTLLDKAGKTLKVFFESYDNESVVYTYVLNKEKMQLVVKEQDKKNVKTITFNLMNIGFADESTVEYGEEYTPPKKPAAAKPAPQTGSAQEQESVPENPAPAGEVLAAPPPVKSAPKPAAKKPAAKPKTAASSSAAPKAKQPAAEKTSSKTAAKPSENT